MPVSKEELVQLAEARAERAGQALPKPASAAAAAAAAAASPAARKAPLKPSVARLAPKAAVQRSEVSQSALAEAAQERARRAGWDSLAAPPAPPPQQQRRRRGLFAPLALTAACVVLAIAVALSTVRLGKRLAG